MNLHSVNNRTLRMASGRRGFSLIELMCAILILGVSVVGLTQGIMTALSSTKEAELQTTAAFIAAGRIELLRADGFIIEGEDEGDCGEDLPLYQWKESITAATPEGLFEVLVTIENSKTGKPIYELQTMLFDPPYLSTATETNRQDNARGGRDARSRDRERNRP
jgi:prepilin-type N-terminal cleavage/methylation domain-containing protein